MGSLLLASGEPGKRYALPNASIMMHQPSGGASGQASDIAIHAREILRVRERLNRIYQKHCKVKDLEAIGKAFGVTLRHSAPPRPQLLHFQGPLQSPCVIVLTWFDVDLE